STRTNTEAHTANSPAGSSPGNPSPAPGVRGKGGAGDLASLPLFAGLAAPRGGLDEDQRAAVAAGPEPLLVLAGPGTGKTRVLTHRIAHLIERGGVPPAEILAVTFTRRAAGELRERLEALLGGERADAVRVRTFHALGLDILAAESDRLGRGADLRVLDDDAALGLLADATGTRTAGARRVAAAIARAKERLLGPDAVAGPAVAAAYRRYDAALLEAGAVDSGDLARLAVPLLRAHADVRPAWRAR